MANPTDYKIYDLMAPEHGTNRLEHPGSIVYPQQLSSTVYSKHFRVDGERVKTIYYCHFDEVNKTYSDAIIKEDYVYFRDEVGELIKIEVKISWMLKSGAWSPETKMFTKPFTDSDKKLDEIRMRRSNIVSEVSGAAKDINLTSAIAQLYDKYFLEIAQYKEAGSKKLFTAITTDDEFVWLDYPTSNPAYTIRMWLQSKFSIAVVNN